MKKLTQIALVCSFLLFTNLSSFTTVAMQKNISHMPEVKAVMFNRLTSDYLNHLGYSWGIKFFTTVLSHI